MIGQLVTILTSDWLQGPQPLGVGPHQAEPHGPQHDLGQQPVPHRLPGNTLVQHNK